MQNILIDEIYKECKEENLKVSKADIKLYLYCQSIADYSEMFKTKLYQKKSGHYCRMLEIIWRCTKRHILSENPNAAI